MNVANTIANMNANDQRWLGWLVIRCQSTIKRRAKKFCERDHHRLASIETVNHRRRDNPGQHGADAIGRHHKSELLRRNPKLMTQLISQRHHDDKTEDVREVNGRQEQNEIPFG